MQVGTQAVANSGYVLNVGPYLSTNFAVRFDTINNRTLLPDGTFATPSITFNSDLDTGFYRPGTDQLGIAAGGATAAIFPLSTNGFGYVQLERIGNLNLTGTHRYAPNLNISIAAYQKVRISMPQPTTAFDFVLKVRTYYQTTSIATQQYQEKTFQISALAGATSSFYGYKSFVSDRQGISLRALDIGEITIDGTNLIFDIQHNLNNSRSIGFQLEATGYFTWPIINATYSVISGSVGEIPVTQPKSNYDGLDYSISVTSVTASIFTTASVRFNDGTATLPSISFISDTDTGIFRAGTNNLSISAGGSTKLQISSSGIYLTGDEVYIGDGSATTPSLAFNSDQDTGFYRPGTDQLGIAAGGATAAIFNISGISIPLYSQLNPVINTSVTGTFTQSLTSNTYVYTLTGDTTFGFTNPTYSTYNFLVKAGTYSFTLDSGSNWQTVGATALGFTGSFVMSCLYDGTDMWVSATKNYQSY